MGYPNDDWMRQAACLPVDPEIFFPTPKSESGIWGGESSAERRKAVKAAQVICEPCPVKAECFAYAHRIGATSGIWAGIDFDDYHLLRRRLRSKSA
jgi:WhiB family redox-sensing transcriptional regulator